jgi:hypothetical protein
VQLAAIRLRRHDGGAAREAGASGGAIGMLEVLFEILCEFVLQLVLEIAVEFGLHAFDPKARRPFGPLAAVIGYAVMGAVAGWLTLALYPDAFVHSADGRAINLLVTPLLAGFAMAGVGAWRNRRGDATLRIDRFAYGYLFALALALVRFHYAH